MSALDAAATVLGVWVTVSITVGVAWCLLCAAAQKKRPPGPLPAAAAKSGDSARPNPTRKRP